MTLKFTASGLGTQDLLGNLLKRFLSTAASTPNALSIVSKDNPDAMSAARAFMQMRLRNGLEANQDPLGYFKTYRPDVPVMGQRSAWGAQVPTTTQERKALARYLDITGTLTDNKTDIPMELDRLMTEERYKALRKWMYTPAAAGMLGLGQSNGE